MTRSKKQLRAKNFKKRLNRRICNLCDSPTSPTSYFFCASHYAATRGESDKMEYSLVLPHNIKIE